MPADKEKADRTVFVGNIPYGLTEEQIVHILGQVGQVQSFRLIYDNETGRPKGFGFAEYGDADSASSAVRNLHGYETMGRELRVAKQDVKDGGGGGNTYGGNDEPDTYNPQPTAAAPPPPQPQATGGQGGLPQLPAGVDLGPGLTCPDAISRTLSTLPAPQLLDILSQMKGLVMDDPSKATELLKQAPQLSYAIFQALLLMGLVDANALNSVIEQTTTAQAQNSAVQSGFPPQYNPHVQAATPPVAAPAYPPPPPQQQQPQAAPAGLDKNTLIQYVLSLSQEQLNSLPPAEREQILGVKAQILSGALRV